VTCFDERSWNWRAHERKKRAKSASYDGWREGLVRNVYERRYHPARLIICLFESWYGRSDKDKVPWFRAASTGSGV
jgi:hypothetical protein